MESIRHLTGVLKSQVTLYSELCDLMVLEKQAISSWAVDKTVELTKQKEDILRRERIQQEARKLLLEQIAAATGEESVTISDAIKLAADTEYADDLKILCEKLVELITNIHTENLALRMLYTTNTRLINDFFVQSGLSTSSNYAANGSGSGNPKVSTICRFG